MKWKEPPLTKIYEAVGAVADGRVHVQGMTATVTSSSGNKAYDISYNPEARAIMANDNGSYWKGYLGYPSVAFLLAIGVLPYTEHLANLLKGVPWKDINQKFKNDFDAALAHILEPLSSEKRKSLEVYVREIQRQANELDLSLLGTKTRPPEGY